MLKLTFLPLLSFLFSAPLLADSEGPNSIPLHTIEGLTVEDHKLGKRQYLVYLETIETGAAKFLSIWNRSTKIITVDGEQVVETQQKWSGDNAMFVKTIYSLNRVDDFSPIYHQVENGGNTVSAYEFDDETVFGAVDVEGNTKADFSMPSVSRTLNWELDMETFALLPLEGGKIFSLNFYHPGSKTEPNDYLYEVTGSEVLTDMDGNEIDCWTLRIDYGGGNYAIFWLQKSDKQMIKMEEKWNDMKRYKVRLGINSGADFNVESMQS